jgi:hypothetical protein
MCSVCMYIRLGNISECSYLHQLIEIPHSVTRRFYPEVVPTTLLQLVVKVYQVGLNTLVNRVRVEHKLHVLPLQKQRQL